MTIFLSKVTTYSPGPMAKEKQGVSGIMSGSGCDDYLVYQVGYSVEGDASDRVTSNR
jgi:hypothetical protein